MYKVWRRECKARAAERSLTTAPVRMYEGLGKRVGKKIDRGVERVRDILLETL